MKKRLLIAGGSHSDIPLIKAAKQLDYHVITSGNNKNDLGHAYADETHFEDFSNKEAMLQLAQKLQIDAICSSANDFSAISSAYIAEKLGLPGHDSYQTTLMIHHKDKFKQFAIKHNFLVPSSVSFTDLDTALSFIPNLSFPSIVKPVDLTGGKGICKIENKEEAFKAIENAFSRSKAKRIVIDKFIDGSLHSFSTIIYKQQVKFYFADNEFSYKNPYLVSTSTSPAKNISIIENTLIEQTEKLAQHLNLVDGILHMQYLLDKHNNIHIVEFTRRMPGDLYAVPVQKSTGLDYGMWILKAFCGLDLSDLPFSCQTGFYSRHCIMANQKGQIKNVHFHPSIKNNIIDSFLWWKDKEEIKEHLTHKCGIVFLKYASYEEMEKINSNINNLITVEFYDDTI